MAVFPIIAKLLLIALSAAPFVVLNALVLRWVSQRFKFHDHSLRRAWRVALAAGLVSLVVGALQNMLLPPFFGGALPTWLGLLLLSVNAAVFVSIIRRNYRLAWKKALLAWLPIVLADLILGLVLAFIASMVAWLVVPKPF
jgi:hypothetical protein